MSPITLRCTLPLTLSLVTLAAISLGYAATTAPAPVAEAAKGFEASYPHIAMLWSKADNIKDKWENMARHGVIVLGLDELGLAWEKQKYAAMAETIDPATLDEAARNLDRIHKLSPAAVVLFEVYFFEETDGNYPPDSPWWLRDSKGKQQQFWPGDHMMDLSNADYVRHIARRIEAVAKAARGKAGIYLDNLRFKPADKKAWTSLLEQVRKACGNDLPILVNAGWDSDDLAWVCPYVNGIMYEDSVAHAKGKDTEAFYARIAQFEQLCLKPHISVNERFGPMTDEARMQKELLRTLVYTDMFYLYSKSTNGHNHKWFDVWSAPLGTPLGPPVKPSKTASMVIRSFAGGGVYWVPETAKEAQSVLPRPGERNALTGQDVKEMVTLQPGQGLIMINPPAAPSTAPK